MKPFNLSLSFWMPITRSVCRVADIVFTERRGTRA